MTEVVASLYGVSFAIQSGITLAKITRPGNIIAIQEIGPVFDFATRLSPPLWIGYDSMWGERKATTQFKLLNIHNGGRNFLYVDGHAKRMNCNAFSSGMFRLVPDDQKDYP